MKRTVSVELASRPVLDKNQKFLIYSLKEGTVPHVPVAYVNREDNKISEEFDVETPCGAIDFQDVERYDGNLGVTKDFVISHQSPVGLIQWNNNLSGIYTDPGNVSGERWCSGTLISENLFLAAGHCFDPDPGNWKVPRINGTNTPIPPTEIAKNMHVNFNYQVDPSGVQRQEQSFQVLELVEYREGTNKLDFAIFRLSGNPGRVFGFTRISKTDAHEGDMICIIQHPGGMPKKIEAGPLTRLNGHLIEYNDIDTMPGSSGSGILLSLQGILVGVHTDGGCTSSLTGQNYGVRISSILEVSPILRKIAGV